MASWKWDLGRRRDMDDVRSNLFQHGLMIGEPGVDAKPLSRGFRHGTRQVADADQGDLWERAQAAQMLLGDQSGSNQCGFHLWDFNRVEGPV